MLQLFIHKSITADIYPWTIVFIKIPDIFYFLVSFSETQIKELIEAELRTSAF